MDPRPHAREAETVALPAARLEAMLCAWREQRLTGHVLTPEELCPQDAELREQLRLRIIQEQLRDSTDEAAATLPLGPTEQRQANSLDPEQVPPGYAVSGILGYGGMGIVYRAVQQRLNRPAALKMILSPQDDQRQLVRFLVEAEAMASVRHPHVAQVYECGEHRGRPFLAMEFLEGGTLWQKLHSVGRLPPPDAAELVSKIADGVAAAHRQGIVHRDLKPGNVLFDAAGEPKVTDFGLAKRGSGQNLTETSSTMGTPAYMSPEQARGDTKYVGPPADVYALGVLLYECLTGTRPFMAENALVMLEQVINDLPQPPRERVAGIPRDLETICLKCLRKEPDKRYATAAELADDLKRWRRDEPIRARPVGAAERAWKWSRRNPARTAAALFVVLTVAGIATFSWLQQRRLERSLAESLAAELLTAEVQRVPRLTSELKPLFRFVEPQLRQRIDAAQDAVARRNAILALADQDARARTLALDSALSSTPAELTVVREMLRSHRDDIAPHLWEKLEDNLVDPDARFRSAALLAEWNAADSRWPAHAPFLSEQLTTRGTLELSEWMQLFDPQRAVLSAPLLEILRRSPDQEEGFAAAAVLARFLDRDVERIIDVIPDASAQQLGLLSELFARPEAAARIAQTWQETSVGPRGKDDTSFSALDPYNRYTRRRARLALAAFLGGNHAPLAEIAEQDADPRVRSHFIELLGQSGAVSRLADAVLATQKPDELYALLLALADVPRQRIGRVRQLDLRKRLLDEYLHEPDPGVHSAIQRLLQNWGELELLSSSNRNLAAAGVSPDRRWWVNSLGMVFAIGPSAPEYISGSPAIEHEGKYAEREDCRTRRVPRRFALATREVTFAEMKQFTKERPQELPERLQNYQLGWSSPSEDCPAFMLDWFDAAAFCNWLSEREGIPKAQWVYPSTTELKQGAALATDRLKRSGYRLPTEAEWELMCRAGSKTRYCFGNEIELLSAYSWCIDNSRHVLHPVSGLKPNRWGMFDMHGNAFEWCDGKYEPAGPRPILDVWLDQPALDTDVPSQHQRTARGGDFPMDYVRHRSGYREPLPATHNWPASGLRLARTLDTPRLDVFCEKGVDLAQSGEIQLTVLGEEADLSVEPTPGVSLISATARVPGSVRLRLDEPLAVETEVRVHAKSAAGDTTTASAWLIAPRWQVRFYSLPDKIVHPPQPQLEDLLSAAAKPAIAEVFARELAFHWPGSPAPNVPADYFGVIAASRVELKGGLYSIGCTFDDGMQLSIDEKHLVRQYERYGPLAVFEPVRLAAGEHTLRADYHELNGDAWLQLTFRRLGD